MQNLILIKEQQDHGWLIEKACGKLKNNDVTNLITLALIKVNILRF